MVASGGFWAAFPILLVNLNLGKKNQTSICICSSLTNRICDACIVSLLGTSCIVLGGSSVASGPGGANTCLKSQ